MPNTCHICGKSAYHDRAGYGFIVNDCDKCEQPVCENCCECDYDLQGDPGRFVNMQWICAGGCKPETFPLLAPPLRSLSEVDQERINDAV
jgi:hypothetical protein